MSDFVNALLRKPVQRRPVWLMRQAGRYLPEYRALRAKAGSFMNLCQNPELACEVTLQPLRRFDLDAAILFSDILTIPDAMGLGLHFETGEGPKFERTVQTAAEIRALPQPDPEQELRYVTDAVRLIRKEMPAHLPLIGFSGSPWTLATYMVEGGSSKQFSKIKGLLYADPDAIQQLMDHLAVAVGQYLSAQIAAGVDAIMIFDTWGGILSPGAYRTVSLAAMQKALSMIPKSRDEQRIPRILFTKNGGQWLEWMAESDCDALGVDWTIPISEARERVGHRVALQGNLDPAVLYADEQTIRQEARKVIDAFGDYPGHVFNLGHGMQPGINPDSVSILIDEVHRV